MSAFVALWLDQPWPWLALTILVVTVYGLLVVAGISVVVRTVCGSGR